MLRLEEADRARARSREEGGEEVVSCCPSLRGRREQRVNAATKEG
jgi:hypothetical protein